MQERGDRLHPGRFHPRRRILQQLARRLAKVADGLPAGETLVDYGCGNRPYEPLFRPRFQRYLGADLPGNAEADLTLENGRIPLDDATVDCVLSSQVLEHVDDPHTYLREAWRVLRPGGALVLSTHGIWPYHPDPQDHWRWTADGLELEIERAGFDVDDVQGVLGFAAVAVQLWQDATAGHLPRFLRAPYVWTLQTWIALLERLVKESFDNAAVYLVLARKA